VRETANARGGIGKSSSAQLLKLSKECLGNVTHFFVENLGLTDVTATFDVGLVNLRGTVGFPFTATFGPGSRTEIFSLSPIDARRQWNFTLTNSYTMGSNRAVHDDNYVYSLPYAAGQAYLVTQAANGTFSHTGAEQYAIDWKMPEGTPVLAARGGVVVGIKDNSGEGGSNRKFENSANYVLIQHSDGTIGNYAHLLKNGSRVNLGQTVAVGTILGLSGNTGFSSGPHLHFSVFKTRDGRQRESIPIHFRTEKDACATLLCDRTYAAPAMTSASLERTPVLRLQQ
jgi:murein DD-endopeptidase MepM/ murein hydrolase activator NlpD